MKDAAPYDLLKDFGVERLALLGAISLSWNLLEGGIDVALGLSLELLPPMWDEVSSRINGFDGKVAIIKKAAKVVFEFPPTEYAIIANTLGAAEQYKKYRDAVAHVQVLDPKSPTAPSFKNKGDTFEVFITKDALENLFRRIQFVRCEMDQVVTILHNLAKARERIFPSSSPEDDRQSCARELRAALSQIQEYQAKRSKLPPLPEFPKEPATPTESATTARPPDSSR